MEIGSKVAGFKTAGSDQVVPFTFPPLSEGWEQVTAWQDTASVNFEQVEADEETRAAIENEADALRDGILSKLEGTMPVFPQPKVEEANPGRGEARFNALVEQLRAILFGGAANA